METGKRSGCLTVVLCVWGVVALLVGVVFYWISVEKEKNIAEPTVLMESAAEDEMHTLTIYSVGEPRGCFGSVPCRFQLKRWGLVLYEYSFEVANDGGYARPDNFAIEWDTKKVTVTVSADEAYDKDYILWFDGSVTVSQP